MAKSLKQASDSIASRIPVEEITGDTIGGIIGRFIDSFMEWCGSRGDDIGEIAKNPGPFARRRMNKEIREELHDEGIRPRRGWIKRIRVETIREANAPDVDVEQLRVEALRVR